MLKMDEVTFNSLLEFKSSGNLPQALSKNDKIVFLRKAKRFKVQNEVLHYIKKDALAEVIQGADKAKNIFNEFHSTPIGAHCGIHKTLDSITKRFYWPGMSVDIKKWVRRCEVCQKRKTSLKSQSEYTPIVVAEPWEVVGMDLVGKLTPTKDGYQYICVMVDYFSKWCEAFPLKSKRAEEVTNCIVQLFYKFGAPKRLLTDQGTEFVNKINLGVCQILGIKRSLCAPYHPQTNGLVERLNGTIQRTLSKLADKRPNSWSEYLDAAMFGLRTKKQLTTKYSPYFLLFGREARYPCEVPCTYEINESIEEMVAVECISEAINRQDRIYELVKENMAKVHCKIKKRKLLQGKPSAMQVGDRVLRQNVRSQQRKGGKLDPDYIGPYTITKVDGKSIDLIDDKGKIHPKINIDHIIHFLEDPLPPKQPKITPTSLPVSVPPANAFPITTQSSFSHTSFTVIQPITLPFTPLFLHNVPQHITFPIVNVLPQITSLPAGSCAASLPATAQPGFSAHSQPSASCPVTSYAAHHPSATGPAASCAAPLPAATFCDAPLPAAASCPAPLPAATFCAAPPPAASHAVPQSAAPLPAATSRPAPLPAATFCAAPPPAASHAAPQSAAPLPAATSRPAPPPAASHAVPQSAAPLPAAACRAAPPSAALLPAAAFCDAPPAAASHAAQLPTGHVTNLQDIWAGNVGGRLCSKIGPFKLFTWDFQQLRPGEKLESEVLNAYLTHLASRYAGRVFVIDSFQMTNIWNGKSRSMKRLDPMAYDVLLGSINEGDHWTLLVIYPPKRRIIYMNSCGESSSNVVHCRKAVRAFMDQKGFYSNKWQCVTLPHGLQPDDNSCGVLVCKFAEAILTGEDVNFPCTKPDIARMRQEIGQLLLKESEDISDSCLSCGHKHPHTKEKLDTWIQCDSCSGWYHWDCVSRPNIETFFICPACQGPCP